MKRYIVLPVILLATLATEANENASVQAVSNQGYQECVAVSLFTVQGRELNSAIENNRRIDQTNVIPKGWTVVGVTTKKEANDISPYLVICH